MKDDSNKKLARARIAELFVQAERFAESRPELVKRYMALAKKIGTKYNVRFTNDQKLRCCKQCGAFLVQGKNARIRLERGVRVLTCTECRFMRRFGYK